MTKLKLATTSKKKPSAHKAVLPAIICLFLLLLVICISEGERLVSDQRDRAIVSAIAPLEQLAEVTAAKSANPTPPPEAKDTIAYIITLTECQEGGLLDGAAVLAHSIHLNSIRSYHTSGSMYDYKLYAIVHSEAKACAKNFTQLNYTVLVRDSPVGLSEIKKKRFRKSLEESGCCGERELLKLYALTMHQHKIVVVFDMDSLLFKPMDALFDAMLLPDEQEKHLGKHAMFPRDRVVSRRIHSYFTRDYIAGRPRQWRAKEYPMQGGFWIVQPNQTAYEEFLNLVRVGNYSAGWYDGTEKFKAGYGGQSIQGIIPWYYSHLHPDQFVELDHCLHNNQVYNPIVDNQCIVPGISKQKCPDCRKTPISELYSWHGTWCGKPWECKIRSDWVKERFWRCQEMMNLWFEVRHRLETEAWGREHSLDNMTYFQRHTYGYCQPNYSPMVIRTRDDTTSPQ